MGLVCGPSLLPSLYRAACADGAAQPGEEEAGDGEHQDKRLHFVILSENEKGFRTSGGCSQ